MTFARIDLELLFWRTTLPTNFPPPHTHQADEFWKQPSASQGRGRSEVRADLCRVGVRGVAGAGGRGGDAERGGAARPPAAGARHHPARWETLCQAGKLRGLEPSLRLKSRGGALVFIVISLITICFGSKSFHIGVEGALFSRRAAIPKVHCISSENASSNAEYGRNLKLCKNNLRMWMKISTPTLAVIDL